jgi:hypothetical protein
LDHEQAGSGWRRFLVPDRPRVARGAAGGAGERRSRRRPARLEDAFRLYLDYDGRGAKVAGDSVRAVSSDLNAVGAYAVAGAGKRLLRRTRSGRRTFLSMMQRSWTPSEKLSGKERSRKRAVSDVRIM